VQELLDKLPIDDLSKVDPLYTGIAVAAVVVWLYMVFLPSRILEKKGHGIFKRFLATMVGLAGLWLIVLILAIKAKDKNKVVLPPKRKNPIGSTLNLKKAKTGFVTCAQCGQQNASDLAECWNCKKDLPVEEADSTPKVSIPGKGSLQGKEIPDTKVSIAATKVALPRANKQMTDETQKLPNRPGPAPKPSLATGGDVAFKVRCLNCGKSFGGTSTKLARVKACPKCKTAPFSYELI
jgi:hypothetical protein